MARALEEGRPYQLWGLSLLGLAPLSESKVKFNEQSAYGIAGLVVQTGKLGRIYVLGPERGGGRGGSNNENPGLWTKGRCDDYEWRLESSFAYLYNCL